MEAVRAALERIDTPFLHLEQRCVLSTSIEMEVDLHVRGRIRCGEQSIDLSAVSACYFRPDDSRQLPSVVEAGENSLAWRHALAVEDTMILWADITPAFVMNRPSAMSSNSSKPYQLELIKAYGLSVPETLITTDPAAVIEFQKEHGEIIYKSVSGIRSRVSKFRPEHLDRVSDVTSCPTQFQQYIPGTDYRVHVAGEKVFTSRIVTAADDYRYAGATGDDIDVTSCEIPDDLAAACKQVALGLGLPFAGLDLRQTPDGRWYCFEANPSPGFTFYDREPGAPIASAVAQMLASASI